MSALRLCQPGQPIHLVDLGPATPYRNPFATLGGHKVQGRSGTPHVDNATRAAANRRWRAKRGAERKPGPWHQPLCGEPLRPGGKPSEERCARRVGHRDSHRSAAAMEYNRRVRRGES